MIYLDHAASTALRPEARAARDDVLALGPANPTGAHARAQAVRAALEDARESLACDLGVAPGRVVFTSGGTESDNWAVRAGAERGTVLYSAVEHPAVAVPAEATGGTVIPVDTEGRVDVTAFEGLVVDHRDRIGCVSVMAANNETGVLQPLAEIGEVLGTHCPGCIFHSDAVQAFTKAVLDVDAWGLGAVSLSGHKIGAPVGIGALVLGEGVELTPLLVGGGQERGHRAGTPDAAGAAAFAAAAHAALTDDWERVRGLRDELEASLGAEVEGLVVHGQDAPRVPTHLHVGIPGVAADMAVIACDMAGLAVSSGSSCSSGAQEASATLAAMGAAGDGALRFSLGWTTTSEDIAAALDITVDVVRRLRG
ncbi:MAG: aminotransferase class V-fold PLP-dependent enzyme [Acidimicrobiia bacterium]|nr:aminotransferase class V-fold PLP-dependent enzyme [Acidimicrobiia bacterium]